MRDFIDLEGASGVHYRYRYWAPGAGHLPTAGNYACVREGVTGPVVVAIGVSPDLSALRAELSKTPSNADTHVYTRLNVARVARMAEYEDLAERYGVSGRKQPAG